MAKTVREKWLLSVVRTSDNGAKALAESSEQPIPLPAKSLRSHTCMIPDITLPLTSSTSNFRSSLRQGHNHIKKKQKVTQVDGLICMTYTM